MTIIKSVLPAILLSVLFGACSPKVPFTQSVRDQYKLSGEEIKKIQFYLSDPVILRRGSDTKDQKATDAGTLIIKSGKDIEQVVFKANTPGTVEQVVDASKFTVAFEEGAEKFLVFGSGNNRSGYYYMQALNWEGGKGKINYGGQTYYSNPGSDKAILLFKMKSLRDVKVKEKVVRGKKLN